MATQIILPEHNSSRLLFIKDAFINNGLANLEIEDLETDHCDCSTNKWLLGKLSTYVWLIEDVGVYDSNHIHQCNIYYTNVMTGDKVILFTVTRAMEYADECDRIYTQHSGGMKLLLLDSTDNIIVSNLYVKYERNLPPSNERIIIDSEGHQYIALYAYDKNGNYGVTELIGIANHLNITDNNQGTMAEVTCVDPVIQNVNMNFSKISISYILPKNTTNDIKVGILGINSVNKRFVSWQLVNQLIEPSYFIVQAPENRSWICFRVSYGYSQYGEQDASQKINNGYSSFLYLEDSALTGYFGTYNSENNTYIYEYTVNRNKLPFHFLLPNMFNDYISLEAKDSSGNPVNRNNQIIVFNELDGLTYTCYSFDRNSRIDKIVIIYKQDASQR